MSRLEFKQRTKNEIRKKAGDLCSNPACLRSLVAGLVNKGDVAHIYDATKSEPYRGQGNLTEEQLISSDNGVLLCKDCHGTADNREQPTPAETLIRWKRIRETAALNTVLSTGLSTYQPIVGAIFVNDQFKEVMDHATLEELKNYKITDADLKSITQKCLLEYLRILSARTDSAQITPPPFSFKRISAYLAELWPEEVKTAVNYDDIPACICLEEDLRNEFGKCAHIESGPIMKEITAGYVSSSADARGNYKNIAANLCSTVFNKKKNLSAKTILHHEIRNSFINLEVAVSRVDGDPVITKKFKRSNFIDIKLVTGHSEPIIGPNPNLYAWDSLITDLENGDDLILIFPENLNTPYSENFPVVFEPRKFKVRLSNVPDESIKLARKYLDRALGIIDALKIWEQDFEPDKVPFWYYSPACFNGAYDTASLKSAMEQLKKAVAGSFNAQKFVQFAGRPGSRLVLTLTYNTGVITLSARGGYLN